MSDHRRAIFEAAAMIIAQERDRAKRTAQAMTTAHCLLNEHRGDPVAALREVLSLFKLIGVDHYVIAALNEALGTADSLKDGPGERLGE